MKSPTEERFREIFNLLERHIEDRYEIPVRVRDVPSPFTGDLDGREIHVDFEEEVEGAVFIIAHLFGHTVQWNLCSEAREIGSKIHENPSEELLQRLHDYEREACGYSLRLFHEQGIVDCDQWLTDFSCCDLAYLKHFYRTGEKRPFRSFWKDGEPLIAALPIPDFTPTRWFNRWEGIVV